MPRRVSAARLAKKRANWRAKRQSVGLFPAFYYSLGCTTVGDHSQIPHKRIPFTTIRYMEVVKRFDDSDEIDQSKFMLEIAKAFNLRDNRWHGLAGYIDQMAESGVKSELIDKFILADHLDVWKKFDATILSRHEWDKANTEIDRLINNN